MSGLLVATVQDSLQALNRVVSLLRGRRCPIERISVARSQHDHLAYVTIVVNERQGRPQHIASCLEKLDEVVMVAQPGVSDIVSREGALIKVRDSAATASITALEGVARVVDRVSGATILEMFGEPDTVQRAIASIPADALIECVRFGPFVMYRGTVSS